VGAELSGLVTKLNVTVGSAVHAGEVIAEIAPRGLSERVAQAQAQLRYDEIALEKAKLDLERSERLSSEGLIARQQPEDLREDEREAEAKLLKSKADLSVIESDLPYTQVRAPISGVISSISTEKGETVAASFASPTFATILERDALELTAMVDETDIGNVRPGDPVTFTVDTYPGREYHGKVSRIAPAGTILSGVVNYEVGIHIAGPAGLRPDMTANVSITTAKREALFLPPEALKRSGAEAYVYVRRGTSLERRTVVPGTIEAGSIEIRRGVSDHDAVAILRNDRETS
jgi:HlyD family secretion protein